MSMQALEGIRILDLGQYVSAPYCTKLFGTFGAEVIKVEKPGTGDESRSVGPFLDNRPHPERSALFLYLNTNKKGITLNLEKKAGVNILKDLVSYTDVLVENFPPRHMETLGLGYETLEKINPKLVMASISDFGQSGPYRDYKGGTLVDYALSGYMYVNGDPNREPLAGGGEQPAYQGGLHAFTGAMAALLNRDVTGKGQHIDISIMECMTSIHQFTVNRYAYTGVIQKRIGNRYMWTHPSTIYPCKDGYVCISPNTEDKAEMLFTLMGMPEINEDPRFGTGYHRREHAHEFDELVRPWFLEKTKKEIVEACQEWRIPAMYVNNVEDLLKDPHYKERGFWVYADHPEAGKQPFPIAPFRMSETTARSERAPLLGEHNEEIYCKLLNLGREDLRRLWESGVI